MCPSAGPAISRDAPRPVCPRRSRSRPSPSSARPCCSGRWRRPSPSPLGCRRQPLLWRRIGQGRWVTGDSVYGGADHRRRRLLERHGRGYVLAAVTSTRRLGLKPVEDWLEERGRKRGGRSGRRDRRYRAPPGARSSASPSSRRGCRSSSGGRAGMDPCTSQARTNASASCRQASTRNAAEPMAGSSTLRSRICSGGAVGLAGQRFHELGDAARGLDRPGLAVGELVGCEACQRLEGRR